ncbi:glycogenin-1-like [Rhopilema esculentum]|uniref:glycogenin-1-like n=1 Tax=Rhopilema esculentum TaxID=499914 RepID=UPI0031DFC203
MAEEEAFVSLAVNDTYATTALVLGDSLRDTNTSRKLALLISNNVSQVMRNRLTQVWDDVILVDELQPGYVATPSVVDRPELGLAFFKLKIWTLTQYRKCVFIDADNLVLQNIDELFKRDEMSAAPDIGWPDCFNSGVFVFVPSFDTYQALVRFADEHGSFDGTDQGLLNMYFKEWSKTLTSHLPYIYNMVASTCYTYAPAINHYGKSVKVVRYAGSSKPWAQGYDYNKSHAYRLSSSPADEFQQNFHKLWWDRYYKLHPDVPFQQEQSSDQHVCHERRSESPAFHEDPKEETVSEQQKAWERGEIDFTRKDRFDVIQHYIDNVIEGVPNVKPPNVDHDDYQGNYGEPGHNEKEQNFANDQENDIKSPQDNHMSLAFHLNYHSAEYTAPCDFFPPSEYEVQTVNRWSNHTDTETSNHTPNVQEEVKKEETVEEVELDPEQAARLRWELGNIDFTGEDSFNNIELYLNSLLQKMEKSLNTVDGSSNESRIADNEKLSNVYRDPVSPEYSRASGETSPVLSLTDSAYSELVAQKPEKISRATQTSYACISKAVQTEIQVELDDAAEISN